MRPVAVTSRAASPHLDGHDGEGHPETADRVGDQDEGDYHHEGGGDQNWLESLGGRNEEGQVEKGEHELKEQEKEEKQEE